MIDRERELRDIAAHHGQEHVFRFWGDLGKSERAQLLADLECVDFALMKRLVDTWIHNQPQPETFDLIEPVPVIRRGDARAKEAFDAGETALRAGRVGLFLVAGGQGTRLGFDGPKGAYPIGPITGKTLFAYHAEKIHNLQRRYGCVFPWYIMVSDTNAEATAAFFRSHGFFGLAEGDVRFIRQAMLPCVDGNGRFMLETRGRMAVNPNGHGGCIPAMAESGVLADARARGIDVLSYFQVDNWAVKVADPLFIGYHVLRNAEMSSKNHRKDEAREAVGVHCLCDGEYRVIEYTELDIYPQLLVTDGTGTPRYAAGNPAIHLLSVDFVQRVYQQFDRFPWHRAHKRIACVDEQGNTTEPEAPNGYKFETFVFDALRFIRHEPVALEIKRAGEYTPIKQREGKNSVVAARESMAAYWAGWLEVAGCPVPRDSTGNPTIAIEISPSFALTRDEFVEKSRGKTWPIHAGLAIDADGRLGTERG